MATSDDGVHWTAEPRILLKGLARIGAWATDDGIVRGSTVYVLATADGETWSSHAWTVGETAQPNLLDLEPFVDEGGRVGVTCYSAKLDGNDPIPAEGDHAVASAYWADGGFTEVPEPLRAEAWLADPAVCALDDERWLFNTYDHTDVHVAYPGSDGTLAGDPDQSWSAYAVPSRAAEGHTLRVTAPAADAPGDIAVRILARGGTIAEETRLTAAEIFPDQPRP